VSASGETVRRCEAAAYVLLAGALLFVFRLHLVPALVAGLLLHTLLHRSARLLSGPRLSHGAARWIAAGAVALLAAGLTTLVAIGLASFARGHLGDLPGLYARMADVLDDARRQLAAWGVSTGALEEWQTAEQIKAGVADWLREHAAELKRAGGEAGRTALHVLMGILAALLVFFRRPAAEEAAPPFAAALAGRVRRVAEAFERIVIAQVEISGVNTLLTALYLFAVVPILAERLPFSGTLVLVTFVAGLLPVVGNLVSNSAIVVLSFGTAPWLALVSLGFLVLVHKLEYLVNARLVGNRIGAEAWEIFIAIVALEVAFGVPGVVLAPILYAWVKGELREKGLV
jgi:predicted PurR-regulated permease PerM